MYKLIRLEMKKMKFGGILRNAIIANILIAFFCIFSKGGHEEGYLDYWIAFADIGTYVRVTFIIFSTVLMAKMIIDEYRDKTISVLFTYPISRKKLLLAKLIPIAILTLITVIISNVGIVSIFLVFDKYYNFVPQTLNTSIVIEEAIRILIFAAAVMGGSLIPIYFGMKKKSTAVTIVSSFIISQVYMSIMNNSRIYNNLMIALLVSLIWITIGVICSYMAIRKLEVEDVN